MENDLISVIVPVYNVELYLNRCLTSIVNQTYKKLEIILVDDGSTDNSSKICDEYSKKDSRIKVIHKKNGGLSDARNKGIDIATGKYITFVDSDDYIDVRYVQNLYNMVVKYNSEISCCSFKSFDEVEPNIEKNEDNVVNVLKYQEAIESLCYQKKITTSAWAKMYKTNLFDGIRYPYGMVYEDLATTYKLFYKANLVAISDNKLYFYYLRNDSIMRKKFSSKNFDRIKVSYELLEFIEKNIPKLKDAAITRLFVSNVQVLRELPLDDIRYESEKREILQNIKKYRNIVFLNKKAKFIIRFIAITSYLPQYFFQSLGSIYKKVERIKGC